MKKLVIFVLLFFYSALAFSSNWVPVDASGYLSKNNLSIVWIDAESMQKIGHKVKVWVRWNFSDKKTIDGSFPVKYYKEIKVFNIFRCDNRSVSTDQIVYYSDASDSANVVDQVYFENSEYRAVTPDTMEENVFKFVCNVNSKNYKQSSDLRLHMLLAPRLIR